MQRIQKWRGCVRVFVSLTNQPCINGRSANYTHHIYYDAIKYGLRELPTRLQHTNYHRTHRHRYKFQTDPTTLIIKHRLLFPPRTRLLLLDSLRFLQVPKSCLNYVKFCEV